FEGNWYLVAKVENTSRIMARFVLVIVELPPILRRRLIIDDAGWLIDEDNLLRFRIRFRNKIDEVLFPDEPLQWTQKLRLAPNEGLPPEWRHLPRLQNIRFRAFADEMPVIERELSVSEVVSIEEADRE